MVQIGSLQDIALFKIEYGYAHPSDLSKILCDLTRQGILEKTGSSKGVIYHIVGMVLPNPEDVFGIIDSSSPIIDSSSPIIDFEYLKTIDSRD
ncbi:hypothetical protein MNBD_GAMMA03-486, partial [hydrothermal vent metagenome]